MYDKILNNSYILLRCPSTKWLYYYWNSKYMHGGCGLPTKKSLKTISDVVRWKLKGPYSPISFAMVGIKLRKKCNLGGASYFASRTKNKHFSNKVTFEWKFFHYFSILSTLCYIKFNYLFRQILLGKINWLLEILHLYT